MRQSHQKSRSRGRNRKPQNPMSRNYESNGPDVKIRGNAGHIADKYASLARDALSNGDTVMAENYYQHAEHYNRIIAAAQAQKAEEQAAAAAANAANGRGPQSETSENADDTASEIEVAAEENGEVAATDAGDDAEGATEQKERRNGRGRRTKRVAAETNGNSRGRKTAEESSEPKAEEKVAVDVEAISDDAAKLPSSITGELQTEDS